MANALVSELVRPLFRSYGENVKVSMLQCYFDDSGTHAGSKIVVWGGLVGTAAQFDALTIRWNALLAQPIEGKPPIKKMQLSSLRRARGDFYGYKQGEIDLLTKKFRDIIVGEGLECVAYMVSIPDWDAVSASIERAFFGNAKDFAFRGVLDFISKATDFVDGGLSCHFDKGAQDDAMRVIQSTWQLLQPEQSDKTSFTFSAVEKWAGLQAADTVAHEAYHYGLHLIDRSYPENPHFIDLRNRTNVAFQSLHEPEMRAFLQKWSDLFGRFKR